MIHPSDVRERIARHIDPKAWENFDRYGSHTHSVEQSLTRAADVISAFGADWLAMETAPKDGSTVEILFVHMNARFARDPVKEGWVAVHEAHWIDFNGGGWTWDGLCGVQAVWRPAAPALEAA